MGPLLLNQIWHVGAILRQVTCFAICCGFPMFFFVFYSDRFYLAFPFGFPSSTLL